MLFVPLPRFPLCAARFAIFRIGFAWWAWVLLFFGDELSYYWFHRESLGCRLLWVSHVVHHSSERYNLSTAPRQTSPGSFLSFVFWLWLPIVGFAPVMIMTMKAASLLYQFWIHTELVRSLGPLEAVLNTPSPHHRVHHGTNPCYIDRNHGGTLILWDKLFGTFEPENPADAVRFGLTKLKTSRPTIRSALRTTSGSPCFAMPVALPVGFRESRLASRAESRSLTLGLESSCCGTFHLPQWHPTFLGFPRLS